MRMCLAVSQTSLFVGTQELASSWVHWGACRGGNRRQICVLPGAGIAVSALIGRPPGLPSHSSMSPVPPLPPSVSMT